MINETVQKHIGGENVNEASYTNKELGRLDNNKNDVLINAQFKDDNGNSTKWLGLNDTESLMALKKFVDERLKMIKKGMNEKMSHKDLASALDGQWGKKNWRIEKSGEVWVNAGLPGAPQIKKWWHYGDLDKDNLIKTKIPSSRMSGGYN